MQKPNWITFTGVDSHTDLYELIRLSEKYRGRVEWGVLFSANRTLRSDNRYPDSDCVSDIIDARVAIAAHLCGDYAKTVNTGGDLSADLPLHAFGRIQVNHRKPDINILNDFSASIDGSVIAQSRDETGFAQGGDVFWLFDKSGGNGKVAKTFPKNIGQVMVGYAGGINPGNVLEVISIIEAERFWIDMESGVRTDDWFDLTKCADILEQVYG